MSLREAKPDERAVSRGIGAGGGGRGWPEEEGEDLTARMDASRSRARQGLEARMARMDAAAARLKILEESDAEARKVPS